MKTIRRLLKILLLILAILCEVLLILVVDYTIYNNNQINIVRQTVQINGLPLEFDGFTILQISDLHGKQFGNSEKGLAGIINSLDYDAIAITGDSQDTSSKDFQPLLELILGIKRKTPIFYISGNTGPFDIYYNTTGDRYSLDMTDGKIQAAGITLLNAGCTLLNWPQVIERGGARLWFATDFSPTQSIVAVRQAQQKLRTTKSQNEKDALNEQIEYQGKLQKIYAAFQPADTLIGIFHIPLTYKTLESPQGLPPYDLVLAGHYHGGQIRLPYLGAIYIPDDTLPWYGLLPPQEMVSGLFIGNGIQQYISRGLGASRRIPFLAFRLFDTPEINLITLKTSK
jgi:predicted MPP superfamily phosphohydrolase